jgi:hypothetical protein
MKKVKRMMFGGISKGVGNAAQQAIAAKKPMGLGEGIARAAGVPVGKTVNAPATIKPIGGVRSPGLGGPTDGPLVKPLPPGVNLPPNSGMGNKGPSGLGVASNTMQQLQSLLKGSPTNAKYMKKGGMVSSASKRADGCAIKGKTKGKMV